MKVEAKQLDALAAPARSIRQLSRQLRRSPPACRHLPVQPAARFTSPLMMQPRPHKTGNQGCSRPSGDLSGGYRRHGRIRGHHDRPRRHDLARSRSSTRHGHLLCSRLQTASRFPKRIRPLTFADGTVVHEGDCYFARRLHRQRIPRRDRNAWTLSCTGDFGRFMGWADEIRTLHVRTNGDTPRDATQARKFGAEGIGLCRTEHMFFEPARIKAVREMIISDTARAAQGGSGQDPADAARRL